MNNPENDTAYAVWRSKQNLPAFVDHLIESLNSAAVDRAVARALLEKAEARYMLCARQVAEYEFQDEVLHY